MPSCLLNVDIGGTKSRSCISDVDNAGKIKLRSTTSQNTGITHVDEIIAHIRQGLELEPRVSAIMIACAGEISDHRQIVMSPNAGYLDGLDLVDMIDQEFERDAYVLNDMEAAAQGMLEMAKGTDTFNQANRDGDGIWIAYTHSTGVGVRLVHRDGLAFGSSELGHIIIDRTPTARLCGCGDFGCAEAYLGGNSLTEMVRTDLSLLNERDRMAVEFAGVNPLQLLDSYYKSGEPNSIRFYDGVARDLAAFLRSLMVIDTDASGFLIKGSVGRALGQLPGFEAKVRDLIPAKSMGHRAKTVPYIYVPGPDVVGQPDDDTFYGLTADAMKNDFV